MVLLGGFSIGGSFFVFWKVDDGFLGGIGLFVVLDWSGVEKLMSSIF